MKTIGMSQGQNLMPVISYLEGKDQLDCIWKPDCLKDFMSTNKAGRGSTKVSCILGQTVQFISPKNPQLGPFLLVSSYEIMTRQLSLGEFFTLLYESPHLTA
jgi:hypothetical protein